MIRVTDESGSAEAATSPSHGSSNSRKESAPNVHGNITSPGEAARAPFDYQEAYSGLEELICTARSRVDVLCLLTDNFMERAANVSHVRVPAHDFDCLLFMIEDTRSAVSALDKRYQESWPAEAAAIVNSIEQARQANAARIQDNETIAELIITHRMAEREFAQALIEDEKIRASADEPETERLKAAGEAEKVARQRILAWRPRSLGASADRLSYLLNDPSGPWYNTHPNSAELHELVRSMVEPG